MSNKEETKITPSLRFPEFENDGTWNAKKANLLFGQISNKNHNSDLPVLAITQEHGAIPRDQINYHVSVSEKSIDGYKVVEVGDFIISLRSFQGGIEYSNYRGICSPAYVILRKKDDKLFDDYFKHFFKSHGFIRELTKNIEGIRDGKMISYRQFSDVDIFLPKRKEELRKIAACLSSIDEVIELESKKLEALQGHKKGLMQNLFPAEGETLPKFRFPEFEDDPEWAISSLADISERITDKVGDQTLETVSITAGHGFVTQKEKFKKDISGKQYKNYTVLNKGEFSYNKGNSKTFPQGCIYQLKEFEQVAAPNAFISFRLKSGHIGGFYQGYFDNNYHGRQLTRFITSGARNDGLLNIGADNFFSITFPAPENEDEQRKIAECLAFSDKILTAQEEKIEQLKEHKKGLMQQLFPNPEELKG